MKAAIIILSDPKAGEEALGRIVLEAHRELLAVSDKSRSAVGAVVAALEAEFERGPRRL